MAERTPSSPDHSDRRDESETSGRSEGDRNPTDSPQSPKPARKLDPSESVDDPPRPATFFTVNEPATIEAGSAVEAGPPTAPRPEGAAGSDIDIDAADVTAALGGDDTAFARLYERHAPLVLAVCRRSTPGVPGDPAEADDALQETFIRAHRQLATLDAPHRIRSWLLGIARRVCSERRRASGRRRRHEETAMKVDLARRPDPPKPLDAAAHDEALGRLGDALDRLGEAERLVIHLYYLDPDPVRAAGEALGISRSGFYKLLGRARDRLAELLQADRSPQRPPSSESGARP